MTVRKFTRWALFSAIAIIALMAVAACGGDDGGSGGPGGPGGNVGTGSDENYVAALCKASKQFSDDLAKITADPSKLKNPDDIGDAFAEPFDAFAKAVSKAKPPSDLKEYHGQFVKTLNDTSKKMKDSKDGSFLSAFGETDFPEPPQAAKDRLEKVAAKNKDCKEAGLFN